MNGLHGIIFSYEKRNNLRELGEIRSAASIPFGGRYRVVDFALSNLVNAGVTDVGVVLNGRYQSMLDHLGTGKVWDLSRKRGGLRILPPFNYQKDWGTMPFRGKLEALAGVRTYLDTIRQDYVALMEGDLVANLPLADIYEDHVKSGADITVVCGNDSFATAGGTYFEKNAEGRVTEVLYNLTTPRSPPGLPGPGGLHRFYQAAEGTGGRVPRQGPVQLAPGCAAGQEGYPDPAHLHLGGLCRPGPLRPGVL